MLLFFFPQACNTSVVCTSMKQTEVVDKVLVEVVVEIKYTLGFLDLQFWFRLKYESNTRIQFYLFNSGVGSSGDAADDAINIETTNKAPKVSMAIGLPVTVT